MHFLEKFFFVWKSTRLVFRINHGSIDTHVEDSTATLDQNGGRCKSGIDPGSQTGRLWLVVSLHAVSDGYFHGLRLFELIGFFWK
ncbi:MAG: hypothetical protein O7F71_20310 [Gammaproteobacteria bacterium]|nr:hypothetical protein [Gammaproteobacteria bacterium]